MARILVTGATGSVAGRLARDLARDNDVVAVARFGDPDARTRLEAAGVECITADLARLAEEPGAVPDDAEVVASFAVAYTGRWDAALAVNAEALGHLVDRSPRLERLVHCSTVGVYAASPVARDESAPLGDSNSAMMPTYSISKIAGEVMARYLSRSRRVPTVIARLGAPYGPTVGGLPWYHLQAIAAGAPVAVHPDGPNRFTLLHEDDLAPSFAVLAEAASVPARVLNWGEPEPVAVEDWCTELGRLVGREAELVTDAAAPPPGALDTSALAALGWRPSVDWRDGMAGLAAGAATG